MPSTYDERIESLQTLALQKEDRIAHLIANSDDTNPSENDDREINQLMNDVTALKRRRATLVAAQAAAAPGGAPADPPAGNGRGRELVPVYVPNRLRAEEAADPAVRPVGVKRADGTVMWRNPPAIIRNRKELDPVDYLVRNAVIVAFAHRERKSHDEIIAKHYGGDENTRMVFNAIQKATTLPAQTDQPGWAAELVTQIQGDFMFPLMPTAVFPRLSALGIALDFGRAGRIAIPTRLRTPSIAGSFVGEGQPIPVRQGQFAAQIITPKKLGVITVMTREIEDHSIPAIEALLRQAIAEDTGVSIDSILLDANPATDIRPPGILNGITVLPPSALASESGGFYRMVRDIRRLRAGLIGPTNDNVRSPCWIMSPIRADAIALNPAPGTGLFPFRDSIRAGTLEGWPVFETSNVDDNTIIAVDAADFVTAGQGAPTFEVSDQATLHMDDIPQPITGGTPSPAVPVRSLWQTDSYALRLLYRLNWMLRRPMVAFMQGFFWGQLDATSVNLIGGDGGYENAA
jgi:Phage capsid family